MKDYIDNFKKKAEYCLNKIEVSSQVVCVNDLEKDLKKINEDILKETDSQNLLFLEGLKNDLENEIYKTWV